MESEKTDQVIKAMALVQAEISPVAKESKAHKYEYANLASVWAVLHPLLVKHGLMVMQLTHTETVGDDLHLVVETLVMHPESGQQLANCLSMPLAKPSDPQAMGSMQTYLRRYSLLGLFCLVTEDDDGQAAQRASADRAGARPAQEPPGDTGMQSDAVYQALLQGVANSTTLVHLRSVIDRHRNASTRLTEEQNAAVKDAVQRKGATIKGAGAQA